MAFSAFKFKRIFSKNAHANMPEQFLNLTKTCKEQAQKMTTPSVFSTSPKVNLAQCKYLAKKLKLAVGSAQSFLALFNRGFPSSEDTAHCLDVFKLLHALAIVVENFIGSCCQDAWIQAAVLVPNVSEHILSISFDLELLTHLFSRRLTSTAVDIVYKAEVATVKTKALQDRETLLREAEALLREREKSSKEYQLAALLLERLGTPRQNLADSVSEAYRTHIESLKQMEQLGRGSFATVYKAMWLGVEVAKKTFYAPSSPELEKEVSILGRLSHPNIASLLCYGGNERECCMVMELMDGDLFGMMQKIVAEDKTLIYPFRILEAIHIMLQVGGGMDYLHEMRIVHRDLKAMNILVRHVKGRELEGKTRYIVAKVADFGLSKTKEKSMTYSNQTLNMGTTRWMAPELIKLNINQGQELVSNDAMIAKYPFSCDVYSFAMVCYEILTGKLPYFEVISSNEVKKKVLRGDRPKLPDYCPLKLKHLMERCWSEDASKRPRFGEICGELQHLKCQLLMPFTQQIFAGAPSRISACASGSKTQKASVANPNNRWFAGGASSKGNKIGILAFEVANTIVKGCTLKMSLAKENIRTSKFSEGVHRLISTDPRELLLIAATDKRNELKLYADEVVRFGNHCRDSQWHCYDRVFQRLVKEFEVPRFSSDEADKIMDDLMELSHNTVELYHELRALDRFRTDLNRKQEEGYFGAAGRGRETIALFKSEVKSQEKHVETLKKRSLWSRTFEEVMEQLVDIANYLFLEIYDNFGPTVFLEAPEEEAKRNAGKLGTSGLALHYAYIINQIDSLVLRPGSVPPNARNDLYQGLPRNVKAALRFPNARNDLYQGLPRNVKTVLRFRGELDYELSVDAVKADLHKILRWLVPVASNTTEAHHVFGLVGEWANTESPGDRKALGYVEITLIQTLHHAHQQIVETYIYELIVLLNRLVSLTINDNSSNLNIGEFSPHKSAPRVLVKPAIPECLIVDRSASPPPFGMFSAEFTEGLAQQLAGYSLPSAVIRPELSQQGKVMLCNIWRDYTQRRIIPGLSKSKNLTTAGLLQTGSI